MRLIKLVFEGTAEEYLVVREQFSTETLIEPSDRATAAVHGQELVRAGAATNAKPDGPTVSTPPPDVEGAPAPSTDDRSADTPDTADASASEAPTTLTAAADDIRRVLQREAFPDSVRRLLTEVAAGGADGVARSALREALGLTDGQLNGVLGTLGRRISATPGLQFDKGKGTSLALLFDVWNDDGWHYRLKPDARQVLGEEGLL